MKTVNTIRSIFIISILVSSCSPEPIFRLHAEHEQEDVLFYRGVEYLISHNEHTSVVIAYYRHVDSSVIMDLEIMNHSNEMIRIDPSVVSFKAYRINDRQGENPALNDSRFELVAEGTVLNPEAAILHIDKQTSKEIAKYRTNSAFEGVFTTLDLVADLAYAGSETATERTAGETQRIREAVERAERRDNFYRNIISLNNQRAYLETESFRVTDLQSGESIAGEIRLPLITKSTLIEISVQFEDDEHTFRYIQKKLKP